MTTSVTLTGLDELKRKLSSIPDELRRGPLNAALAAAAVALRDEVRARAPVGPGPIPPPGTLRDNIIAYRDRNPASVNADAHYSVLVRKIKISRRVKNLLRRVRKAGGALRISDQAFYWRFLEFGWVPYTREYGSSTKVAYPFFRPAVLAMEGRFVGIVGDVLEKKVDAVIKKLGS